MIQDEFRVVRHINQTVSLRRGAFLLIYGEYHPIQKAVHKVIGEAAVGKEGFGNNKSGNLKTGFPKGAWGSRRRKVVCG